MGIAEVNDSDGAFDGTQSALEGTAQWKGTVVHPCQVREGGTLEGKRDNEGAAAAAVASAGPSKQRIRECNRQSPICTNRFGRIESCCKIHPSTYCCLLFSAAGGTRVPLEHFASINIVRTGAWRRSCGSCLPDMCEVELVLRMTV